MVTASEGLCWLIRLNPKIVGAVHKVTTPLLLLHHWGQSLGSPTFIDALQQEGVGAYKVIWPLPAKRPVAAKLMRNTLGFWVHPTYTLREMKAAVAAFERAATRFSSSSLFRSV